MRPVLWTAPLLLAAAPIPATDAAILRAVLAASAERDVPQCVEPATTFPAFSVERELLARSNGHADAAAIRHRSRPIAGDWRGVGGTLDATALQDITDATTPLLERAARIPLAANGTADAESMILTADLLANGQRLAHRDCHHTTLTLSPVYRWREIALVDVLTSSGALSAHVQRWALRFDGKRWRPFASGLIRTG